MEAVCNSDTKCGQNEGDCDSDSDCKDGCKCVQSTAFWGLGTDYCQLSKL